MSFTRTAVIPATPDRVFSILADLEQTKQWMPAVQRIEAVTPGPFRLGTGWKETRKAGNRMLESAIRVASFEPPSRLELEVDSRVMKGQMSFTLAPKEGGTEVQYAAQMVGKGLFRLMSGTMNRMMAAEDSDILDRLRGQVERGR